VPDERAKPAISERIALAGLGSPQLVETRLLRIPYLAREGRITAIVRHSDLRSERVEEGLFGIALGVNANLPLEIIDPRVLQPDTEPEAPLPELSLDSFDQLVREKLEAKILEDQKPTDVDLHPTWGPRVHLVHIPFVSVTFTVPRRVGWLRSIEKHPPGRYQALVSLHDGTLKHVELPKIQDRTELGWLAGVGVLGIVLCFLAVFLLVVVLAVYLS
jgi:hypothetical protein